MAGTFTYTRSTNLSVVTGLLADCASWLTADRAGSVTLLAAWTPNSNTKALTYTITPADKLALIISFVVASKARGPIATISLGAGGSGYTALDTLTVTQTGAGSGTVRVDTVDGGGAVTGVTLLTGGTGYSVSSGKATTGGTGTNCTINVLTVTLDTDYVFITGTDAWDAAQTEAIDVSAGNGTYPSTKRFRTITNIDCSDNAAGGGTVWVDGTIAVTQPQWGVVWDFSLFGSYGFNCRLQIGDGSTATTFVDTDKIILFGPSSMPGAWYYLIEVKASATFTLGNLVDVTTKRVSKPCVLSNIVVPYAGYFLQSQLGTSYLYGTVMLANPAYVSTSRLKNSSRMWHTLQSVDAFYGASADSSIFGMKALSRSGGYALHSPECSDMSDITLLSGGGTSTGLVLYGSGTISMSNINMYGFTITYSVDVTATATFNLTNVVNYVSGVISEWVSSFATGSTATLNRKYTWDLNVTDEFGIPLSGAVDDCKDKDGVDCWTAGSVTTDANGDITQQSIIYKVYTAGATSGSPTIVTKSPHIHTISKAGYKTVVLHNITMDERHVIEVELHREILNMSRNRRDNDLPRGNH